MNIETMLVYACVYHWIGCEQSEFRLAISIGNVTYRFSSSSRWASVTLVTGWTLLDKINNGVKQQAKNHLRCPGSVTKSCYTSESSSQLKTRRGFSMLTEFVHVFLFQFFCDAHGNYSKILPANLSITF